MEKPMSIYNYSCSCGNDFEKMRSISQRQEAECPKCNSIAKQSLS
ncbi:FmdB family zinc ribbon protein, partial [Escherichia coli]